MLHAAAELYPWVKTGGLGDVVAALPPALAALGVDVRLVLPGFGSFLDAFELTETLRLRTPLLPERVRVARAQLPGSGISVYLIDHPSLYDRPGSPYQAPDGSDWPDNHRRFAVLGWVAAALAQGADPGWRPDVLHCHDWHAGLAPAYLRADTAPVPSVFTVHNLAYQGFFPAGLFPDLALPASFLSIDGVEFYGGLSFLKAGLFFADCLTTVSPTYAREIQTLDFGMGLDGLLRTRAGVLTGILNGVDPEIWSPEKDALLPRRFGVADAVSGKGAAKRVLEQRFDLAPQDGAPLFGAVTRLTPQKGLDLLLAALPGLIARGGRLVLLGSGDGGLEAGFAAAAQTYRGRVAVELGYDEALSHLIIAGSDSIVVPSRFEPCGLTQLYALRYGALPLVRRTGGLADTVIDANSVTLADGSATGFAFDEATPDGLLAALQRAIALYREPPIWWRTVHRAMTCDFSWAESARRYATLYCELVRSSSSVYRTSTTQMKEFRAGVDIGGTFTDIVLLGEDGARYTKKVSSTVDDYARAIVDGLAALLHEIGAEADGIGELLHGTTVASNAILEHKGARTGLITTKGFRDVLEIRNLRMPRLYDMSWTKPPPLVERRLRTEVDERVNAAGGIDRSLDEASVERAVRFLVGEGVEAIAVCLLHSYLNPAHELRVKEIAARLAPGITLSVSAEVLPVINEYERTSTTVINAYVRPIVARYLNRLIAEVKRAGIDAPLLLMQSNGGLTTAQAASETPMHIIESGPAAGVVGVQALTRRIGIMKAISFDMGGTTAKASLIENGEVTRATEYQVGAGIVLGSRLLSGAGYTLKVPAIDLAEVGAGGGSILWIDAGGALQIGPHSAGAVPGPVAYDQGGSEPTVTDANLVLGYLNPTHLVGGALKLNADKARAAIAEKIARPLGISVEGAAYGAHLIAASNMIRALKAVSSERGRDPREYALVGFGGNGPLFAAGMAEALSIPLVLIPPSAGVFSSFGLLYAEVEYYFTRTRKLLLRAAMPEDIEATIDALEAEARARLSADGFGAGQIAIRRSASLHYQGQSFELRVLLAAGRLDAAALAALEEAFGAEHERTYGHRAGVDEPVELVSLEVIGRGLSETPRAATAAAARLAPDIAIAVPSRRAYFGPKGWLDAAVINRSDLATAHAGPCIVEEYDATCLVPPGWTAGLDEHGNIMMRR